MQHQPGSDARSSMLLQHPDAEDVSGLCVLLQIVLVVYTDTNVADCFTIEDGEEDILVVVV
jgi:hypothetical protein